MNNWIDFYDFKHSVIFVNARHRDVHYRLIAQDIRAYVPSPTARVLDYGCGEATSAVLVAEAASHLTLVEAAPNMRAARAARYADNPKISVIAADDIEGQPPASFDLIVMHSVAQYLTEAELERLLGIFHRLVKPSGLVIIGDIVPPQLAAPAAAIALLRFGAANGFFWATLGGLIRIIFCISDYVRLNKTFGFSHYTEEATLKKLVAAGFKAKHATRNIGHNQRRMTFLARIV
jgi:SAM-dependent methyltransferase